MRRALMLTIGAAVLLSVGGARAGGERVVAPLVEGIAPREGIEVRSLHVVPLVNVGPDHSAGFAPLPDGAAWAPDEKGRPLVDLVAPAAPAGGAADADGAPVTIVPAGTLVLGGGHERVLAACDPLAWPRARALPTIDCDVRPEPVPDARRLLGPLAPLEQRKLLLLGEGADSWNMLLRIQQLVANTADGSATVSQVLDVPWLRERADATSASLRRIPGAYAGRTRGHVAFFGFRPVEVVIARTPAAYRSLGPRLMRSLAESHALWERGVGLEERALAPAAPADYLPPATRAVSEIAAVRLRRMPQAAGESGAWRSARGNVVGAVATDRFVIRVVSDEGGEPILLEAIENGDATIHPLPLQRPGGKPVDEGPDIRGGSLTEGYLRRLAERRAARAAR